ncbi:ferrochelatase [Marinicella sp. W31]|uniref:ferrochelatase n=1 Tax=Marinicella sp. W31 TaxID=3023713 RepID=UPI003756B4FB
MKYRNQTDYQHDDASATGILITNLGTPDAPEKKALRRYLKEFLSDPRVVEPPPPRWLWWLILNGVILNIRPSRSAKAYQEVWDELGEGSPLLAVAKQQKQLLQEQLNGVFAGPVVVELAMRYGNPSIASALRSLQQQGVRRLLVVPLYPQYSATTTASTFDALSLELKQWRLLPELRFVNHYHDHPLYIQALAASVQEHWKKHGQPDKLIMSYHGLPKRYLTNGDPYHCECYKTSRLLAEALNLNQDQFQVCFQSIFGREEWLKPYTAETLKSLPQQGHNHVQVICPGFSADCLETLEEIEGENREYFEHAGGKEFSYIPALNTRPDHIQALVEVICQHTQGWYERSEFNATTDAANREQSKKRAMHVGAEQ